MKKIMIYIAIFMMFSNFVKAAMTVVEDEQKASNIRTAVLFELPKLWVTINCLSTNGSYGTLQLWNQIVSKGVISLDQTETNTYLRFELLTADRSIKYLINILASNDNKKFKLDFSEQSLTRVNMGNPLEPHFTETYIDTKMTSCER